MIKDYVDQSLYYLVRAIIAAQVFTNHDTVIDDLCLSPMNIRTAQSPPPYA
jgi:hypothetical protein